MKILVDVFKFIGQLAPYVFSWLIAKEKYKRKNASDEEEILKSPPDEEYNEEFELLSPNNDENEPLE